MFRRLELPLDLPVQLGKREIALLRLLMAPGELRLHYWTEFWEVDLPYDSLDVGLKDLIPTAVSMLEEDRGQGVWSVVPVTEAKLLKGLSRHTWARNCVLKRNIDLLMRLFADHSLDLIFINNVAHFITRVSQPQARIVRQIEILINPDQRTDVKQALRSCDLHPYCGSRRDKIKNVFRTSSTMRFVHPEWASELIVRSAPPFIEPLQTKLYTQGVWKRKEKVDGSSYSYVSHGCDRLIMTAHEFAMRSQKNQSGAAGCLADALLIVESLSQSEIRAAFEVSRECWNSVSALEGLLTALDNVAPYGSEGVKVGRTLVSTGSSLIDKNKDDDEENYMD